MERQEASFRGSFQLKTEGCIDIASNDYLGFASSQKLKAMVNDEMSKLPIQNCSTGSRLLTGNSAYAEGLEQWIASYHGHEAELLLTLDIVPTLVCSRHYHNVVIP